MDDEIVIINFKVKKSKRKALKKILIDEDKTLTDFLNECVDNKIKASK